MASFRIFGPYVLDLGYPGLAPGQAQDTYWTGWQPQPNNFTVTVTAHPSTYIESPLPFQSGTYAAQSLKVSDTSVEWVPNINDVGSVDLTLFIHATLVNTGSTPITTLSLFITFVEL
jgi:hypothetical protein